MNYTKYKKYIVVNDRAKPMTFEPIGEKGGQFIYCTTERARIPFPVKVYSLKKARKLIKRSNEYRLSQGFDLNELYLMPVE